MHIFDCLASKNIELFALALNVPIFDSSTNDELYPPNLALFPSGASA